MNWSRNVSLKGRLASTLLLVLIGVGIAVAWVGRYSSQLYFQEVNQTLNASLSMYVVDRLTLIEDGTVNESAFKQLAEQAMTVNPSIEVYVLDTTGRVVAHALPSESIQHAQVPIHAIQEFMASGGQRLVLGQDPRSDAPKAFSASPIMHGDHLQGYLYVILGGKLFDEVQQTFFGTFIGRLAAASLLAVLAIGGIVGFFSLHRATRPLKQLEAALIEYSDSGFQDASGIANVPDDTLEIRNLKSKLGELTQRLSALFGQINTNDRLRRELLANVSHDLRTPLASMQGYIETVLIKEDSLSADERRKYLTIAHNHTMQLNRMVADLFELAKLDSGSVDPEVEEFPIGELLQDVIQEFSLAAADKGITLNGTQVKSATRVSGDIRLLQRVFENLISNALRYTPQGGHIDIELREHERAVHIEVADDGCGIAPDVLPTIFDRYLSDSSSKDSAGLGLAIVKRILELHQSRIEVTSTLNEGTRFAFDLPKAA